MTPRTVSAFCGALAAATLLMTGCAGSSSSMADGAIPLESKTPRAALDRLQEGNARYVTGETAWEGADRIGAHTAGQNPYAIVLSCADSRVPVEKVFDAGIGELFVLRVAGNVATSELIGSAEYAVLALNTPLFVVMGHEQCGAVAGALQLGDGPAAFPPDLNNLLEDIYDELPEGDWSLSQAVEANVREQVDTVLAVPAVAEAVEAGNLRVVGAVYDLDTGTVRFL